MGNSNVGFKGGQHVKFPQRTPMSNLLLTMLDKAGVPYSGQIGDSTGRLDLNAAAKSADGGPQRKTL